MKPGRMPGGANMNALMKQAQKMQADLEKMQAQLEQTEFTASAGGGAVTATVMGKQLKSLTISPEVIDPEDVDMLCDLILAAVNQAMAQSEETMNREMQKITGGMPGMNG